MSHLEGLEPGENRSPTPAPHDNVSDVAWGILDISDLLVGCWKGIGRHVGHPLPMKRWLFYRFRAVSLRYQAATILDKLPVRRCPEAPFVATALLLPIGAGGGVHWLQDQRGHQSSRGVQENFGPPFSSISMGGIACCWNSLEFRHFK